MNRTVFVALAVIVICFTVCYMSRNTAEHKVRRGSVAGSVAKAEKAGPVRHHIEFDNRGETEVALNSLGLTMHNSVGVSVVQSGNK